MYFINSKDGWQLKIKVCPSVTREGLASMKFGEYLEANLYREWRFYYIDYEGLKSMLTGRGSGEGSSFSERDEARFVEALEKEMEKVQMCSRILPDILGV